MYDPTVKCNMLRSKLIARTPW